MAQALAAQAAKKSEQPLPTQHYFLSRKTFTLRSTEGLCISFEAMKPTHVPKALHALAMGRGLVPCDLEGKELDLVAASTTATAAAEPVRKPVAPDSAEDRNEAIYAVLQAMVKRNDSKDFGSNSRPKAEAVSLALGWRVDPKEINQLWDKHRAVLLTGKASE